MVLGTIKYTYLPLQNNNLINKFNKNLQMQNSTNLWVSLIMDGVG